MTPPPPRPRPRACTPPPSPADPATLPGGNPDAAERLGISEAELVGVACLWVRLDPGQDWLADVKVAQPLKMWQWQLQHVSGGRGAGGACGAGAGDSRQACGRPGSIGTIFQAEEYSSSAPQTKFVVARRCELCSTFPAPKPAAHRLRSLGTPAQPRHPCEASKPLRSPGTPHS
jgi:hypothetical protein